MTDVNYLSNKELVEQARQFCWIEAEHLIDTERREKIFDEILARLDAIWRI